MKPLKLATQFVFYLAILAFVVSRSVSAGISHDENQFIAPGQLLVTQGWIPYVNYPYTHMPYSTVFYGISAWISDYDFLAGRLLSCLAWLGSILLMVGIARAVRSGDESTTGLSPSWRQLLWEFLLVFVFVHHGPALFILRTALNHSLATLFGLLAIWFMVRGMRPPEHSYRAAFLSGACIAVAGLTRFNFASLAVVLFVCWLLYCQWLKLAHAGQLLLRYTAGGLTASIPAMAVVALAPRQFYYANLVYIRLNTVYYEQLLRRSGMDLASKLRIFEYGILSRPLDLLLYAVLAITAVLSIVELKRRRSPGALARFCIAGIAAAIWATAFAPSPTLLHYFAGPVPFLFLLLACFEFGLGRFELPARALGVLLVVVVAARSISLENPVDELAVLTDPSAWPPVQVHELATDLRDHVAGGRILTLQPMIPLEAGLEVYPFVVNGPFSWRTSLLLTAERRGEYDVVSPLELAAVLEDSPPDAILEGFEAPNAGFERQEQGGLEIPLSDYGRAHGYKPVSLSTAFWTRGLTLWIKP